MRICAWPCGQAQTPLLLRPSYDEERRRSRRTEGRPLSLSVQFSTARNVQFSAGVDTCRTISVIHRRLKPLGVALSIRCGTSSAQEIHLCARLRGPHVPHLTAKGHIAFVRMLYANHDDERDSAVSVAATMRAQCYFVNEE